MSESTKTTATGCEACHIEMARKRAEMRREVVKLVSAFANAVAQMKTMQEELEQKINAFIDSK